MTNVAIRPLGDSSLLIQVGTSIDQATHERVRAVFDALAAAPIPGMYDVVPAYTSVAVHYDPASFDDATDVIPFDRAVRVVRAAIENATSNTHAARDIIDIPVHYGGDAGPDLEHVARHAGVSTDEVIRMHASAEYRVYMIGFSPGFPYLGGLPPQLATPRRATPRSSVPAGSIGIAGEQTGIYSLSTPGGWQIIGRTEVQLFRPDLDPPTLLRIGDRVRFVAP